MVLLERFATRAGAMGCALAALSCGLEARPGDFAARAERSARPASTSASDDREAAPRETVATIEDSAAARREPSTPLLPPMPRAAERLLDGDLRVDLYPPLDASLEKAPLVAFLHGACDSPTSCGWLQGSGRAKSFLVCPAGNAVCDEDAFDWVGPTQNRLATVDAALAAVDAALGARLAHAGGDVLIGSSRGAYLARDFLVTHPGVFRGVIYIGAEIKPDPVGLERAGVHRVVLACGDYDGAAKQMKRTAAALDAAGIPARFVSFGKMGHGWPRDVDAILTRAIAWIREDPTFGS